MNREYYMVARRYEFYVQVARTISHQWVQQKSDIVCKKSIKFIVAGNILFKYMDNKICNDLLYTQFQLSVLFGIKWHVFNQWAVEILSGKLLFVKLMGLDSIYLNFLFFASILQPFILSFWRESFTLGASPS